jgi:hypothetical protein
MEGSHSLMALNKTSGLAGQSPTRPGADLARIRTRSNSRFRSKGADGSSVATDLKLFLIHCGARSSPKPAREGIPMWNGRLVPHDDFSGCDFLAMINHLAAPGKRASAAEPDHPSFCHLPSCCYSPVAEVVPWEAVDSPADLPVLAALKRLEPCSVVGLAPGHLDVHYAQEERHSPADCPQRLPAAGSAAVRCRAGRGTLHSVDHCDLEARCSPVDSRPRSLAAGSALERFPVDRDSVRLNGHCDLEACCSPADSRLRSLAAGSAVVRCQAGRGTLHLVDHCDPEARCLPEGFRRRLPAAGSPVERFRVDRDTLRLDGHCDPEACCSPAGFRLRLPAAGRCQAGHETLRSADRYDPGEHYSPEDLPRCSLGVH